MTNKERKLVLRDICGRLPWGVYVKATGPNAREDAIYNICEIDVMREVVNCTMLVPDTDQPEGHVTKLKMLDSNIKFGFDIGQVKPILRLRESMTRREEEDYHCILALDTVLERSSPDILMDFFYKNGFDCRGLIEKGLAVAGK